MTIQIVRELLKWCLIINIGVLFFWFLMFLTLRDWIYCMHSKWFKLTREQFDTIHYALMATFKTLIFVFNAVPYIALCIIG